MNAAPLSVMAKASFGLGFSSLPGPMLEVGPSLSSKPWVEGCALPACHLPKWAVAYPLFLRSSAIVVSAPGSSRLQAGGTSLLPWSAASSFFPSPM